MKRWLIALIILMALPFAAAQEDEGSQLIWGVRLGAQFELTEVLQEDFNFFEAAPFNVAGFVEVGRWGAELTINTQSEFTVNGYYIFSVRQIFGTNSETRVGVRTGMEDGQFFIRAQADILLYGSRVLER